MPHKKVKKVRGNASRYISRRRAIRKLGLSLPTFRRLCIYKGIYPRDPGPTRKKLSKSRKLKIYYYKKEINHLDHDPIVPALRRQIIYAKKYMHLLNCGKWLEARKLEVNKPTIPLDHVIKERYPTFTDALRDLDDCLTLIFSLSYLGGSKRLKEEDVRICSTLGLEFKNYVVKTRCLRKVFVTIKGFYYQVNIMDAPITWSEPFKFIQTIPDKVDIRIINAFYQFYRVLLKFVLAHLYRTAGLIYPPKINAEENDLDSGLSEMVVESSLESLVKEVNEKRVVYIPPAKSNKGDRKRLLEQVELLVDSKKNRQEEPEIGREVEEPAGSGSRGATAIKRDPAWQSDTGSQQVGQPDSGSQQAEQPVALKGSQRNSSRNDIESIEPAEGKHRDHATDDPGVVSNSVCSLQEAQDDGVEWAEVDGRADVMKTLFSECFFFLSRETPKSSLDFVIKSCGGHCGWDQYGHGKSHLCEKNSKITHQIVDKPIQYTKITEGRIYVQPQWIYDSINRGKLLNIEDYSPGKQLPPHLSPFVVYDGSEYMPDEARKTLVEDGLINPPSTDIKSTDDGVTARDSEDEPDEEYELYKAEIEAEFRGMKLSEYMKSRYDDSENSSFADKGAVRVKKKISEAGKIKTTPVSEREVENERKKLAMSLLSKKDRKRYEALSRETRRRSNEIKILESKNAKLTGKGRRLAEKS